jgi:putative ABC transport system ATP-binding protein
MIALRLKNIIYSYEGTSTAVLKGINAEFEKGLVYTIIGKSGAGKTTLLSLISGLDLAKKGSVVVGQEKLEDMDRDEYRAKKIGVIFQGYNLLTNATAVENIILSMHISGSEEPNKKAYAYQLLEKLGIDKETANRKVLKLSGGQQQRVGIARAISHNPDIIIADEPTGNLDEESEKNILDILSSLAHIEGKCVIIVTHSKEVTNIADEVLLMKDGKMIARK